MTAVNVDDVGSGYLFASAAPNPSDIWFEATAAIIWDHGDDVPWTGGSSSISAGSFGHSGLDLESRGPKMGVSTECGTESKLAKDFAWDRLSIFSAS